MSTSSPCLDVDQITPAIVEWVCNDATHYFAKPDPKIDEITLKCLFCAETSSALFELRFPLNLKGVGGVSDAFIRICVSSIISLDFTYAAAPDAAQEKLGCSALLRLGFQLNQNLNVLVPVAAKDPLSPTRAQSGKVLDTLRMLSKVTSFGVYIRATKLPKAKLQSISDAVSQARLKPLRHEDDLTSMYHGTGAKIADLSARTEDAPPPYHEAEPPPPMAPINEKKRQRAGSQDEPTSQITLIWAELRAMQKQNRQQVVVLDKQNHHLQQLQQQVVVLEKENRDLKREVEQLQADDHKTADTLESIDSILLELRDDHEDLEAKVDFIKEHGVDSDAVDIFVQKVKNRVLDDITMRLSTN